MLKCSALLPLIVVVLRCWTTDGTGGLQGDTDGLNQTDPDNSTTPPAPQPTGAGSTAPVPTGGTPGAPTDLGLLFPNEECNIAGYVFDSILLRCSACTDLDPRSVSVDGECECVLGLVECKAGEICAASGSSGIALQDFTATTPLECRDCPLDTSGDQMAPTRDGQRCLPCGKNLPGGLSTLGYSAATGDCLCQAGFALQERGADGAYLAAKQCVQCAAGSFPGPPGDASSVYDCAPCPDPERTQRNPDTGVCECRDSSNSGATVAAGGICIDMNAFNQVNSQYPEASAIRVPFRDSIDDNPGAWEIRPLGQSLGIAQSDGELLGALELGEAQSQSVTVDSVAFKWLYVRSAVGCLQGNSTACQCISNLCVLALYEDQATACRFLIQQLYEGRPAVSSSTPGHYVGLPWIMYSPELPKNTLEDQSLAWRYTLGDATDGDTSNTLEFWLAKYSLEGEWLGWERLDTHLELCKTFGGYTEVPSSARLSWRRFGSSLSVQCEIPVFRLLHAGLRPTFYELFIVNADGTLAPVPVRLLNTVQQQQRPNLNVATDDIEDDFLVRRFLLLDAVSGKEGSDNALFDDLVAPRIFRWASYMTMQIKIREGSDAQIYMPVLSIAYAEKTGVGLADTTIVPASFIAEYSMDTGTFWTFTIVFFVLLCLLIGGLSCYRVYLVAQRYPAVLLIGAADPGMFIPRFVIQALAVFATTFSLLLWFHFILGMYWFIIFKGQDIPHLLLPSAFEGEQYMPHDILMILEACFGVVCVGLGFAWQMKTFIFLLDWERADPGADHAHMAKHSQAANAPQQQHQDPQQQPHGFGQMLHAGLQATGLSGLYTGYGHGQHSGHGLMGSLGGGGGFSGQQGGPGYPGSGPGGPGGGGLQPQVYGASRLPHQQSQQPGYGMHGGAQEVLAYTSEAPDRGISAWRSLFVCNELNERLASTRTVSHVTWLMMCLFLEGFGLKHWARWYPGLSTGDHMVAAAYNPFLQFALGTCTWMLIVLSQLVLTRLASIWVGHDLIDFVDVCAVANVSVIMMDEPFHGYYIHGKAPSSKGDWCHTELAKAIHDEAKGIGFTRGLTPDSVQTFEMLLPPSLHVTHPGGGGVDFREHLHSIFMNIATTRSLISQRTPPLPTESDVAHLSLHRCSLSSLFDATIHAMMQAAREVVQVQTRWQKFWGVPPYGGVLALRQPVLYEDKTLLSWSCRLAHGNEIRIAGLGLPTGFEWHLISLEMLMFSIVWRFADSIFLAAAVAFILNRVVIGLYAVVGRYMLSRSTLIDPMFLL